MNIIPTSTGPNTNNQNSDGDGNDTNIKRRDSKWTNEWEEDLEEHREGRGNDTIGAEKRTSKDVNSRRLNGGA